MTVIVARKHGDHIVFAADQQVTAGHAKCTKDMMPLSKVAQVNRMTIGGSGSAAHTQWLLQYAKNHSPLNPEVECVAEFMLDFCEWMRKKDGGFVLENSFLIAYRDELFRVYDSLSVFRVPVFSAIGSGQDYALAAMHLGNNSFDAARVAADLDLYCSGDIKITNHRIT